MRELFVTPAARERHRDLVRAADDQGTPVTLVEDKVLAGLSDSVTPQGVIAVVTTPVASLDDVLTPVARLIVALVAARDPGNVGSVIRVADAAGADGVVLTPDCADAWSPKAVRASAGSALHLPIASGVLAPDLLAASRSAGLQSLAADGTAEHRLDDADIRERLDGPTIWVFGNEAWGLPPDVRAAADLAVAVPLYGKAESLNLATAAAVCLYASAQAQRRT